MNPRNTFQSGPRRRGWGRLVVPAMLLLVLAAYNYYGREPVPNRFDAEAIEPAIYEVQRVVDGDTIIVLIDNPRGSQPRRERLRLLGIDTPETVKEGTPVEPWGPEASAFTKEFLAGGRARLEFDKRRIDQYGRYLAYVYVDDRMLNEALVSEGLARVSFYEGDNQSMERRFKKAQAAAKEAGRGIWSDSPP